MIWQYCIEIVIAKYVMIKKLMNFANPMSTHRRREEEPTIHDHLLRKKPNVLKNMQKSAFLRSKRPLPDSFSHAFIVSSIQISRFPQTPKQKNYKHLFCSNTMLICRAKMSHLISNSKRNTYQSQIMKKKKIMETEIKWKKKQKEKLL